MVKSPIKVIESGNVPTTDNLGKGQVAFGQVGDSVKFYGSDGTTVTELNAGTQINSVAPLMVETEPEIPSSDNMKGSIAIGNSAQVSSPGTTVSGAVAIGDHATVGSRGASGIAIGRYSNVVGNDIAIGANAKSVWDSANSAGGSIVIGNNAKSDTTGVNVGRNIAIGYGAVTKKRCSIAVGNNASADDFSICIGSTNYGEGVSGRNSIAIGNSTNVPADGSICISSSSSAEVTDGGSILIGAGYLSSPSPSVGNSNVVAIGRNVVDNANSSVVIGAYAKIADNANGAVVIGSQSNTTEPYTFSVGSGDATMNLSDDMDEETKARIQARAAAATRRIVNVTDPVNAQDAATKAYVDAHTGGGTEVDSIAPLTVSTAPSNIDSSAIAIGNNARARASNTVAIGNGSYTNETDTVSFGSTSNTRRIINVKDPQSAQDAATKKYVDDAVAGKADASMLDSYATKTELAAKADQTAVDTLTTTVNSKANQSDLSSLQTTVASQAETISQLQATITQLQSTIDNLTLKTEEIL